MEPSLFMRTVLPSCRFLPRGLLTFYLKSLYASALCTLRCIHAPICSSTYPSMPLLYMQQHVSMCPMPLPPCGSTICTSVPYMPLPMCLFLICLYAPYTPLPLYVECRYVALPYVPQCAPAHLYMPLCTSIYPYTLLCTPTHAYAPLHASTLCTSAFLYATLCTPMFLYISILIG